MKKNWLVLTLMVFLSFCSGSTKASENVFGNGDSFGVITGNTVKFYVHGNGRWNDDWRSVFMLPNNYKQVFGNGDSFGVITGNTVKFYVHGNGKWNDDWRSVFMLPNN